MDLRTFLPLTFPLGLRFPSAVLFYKVGRAVGRGTRRRLGRRPRGLGAGAMQADHGPPRRFLPRARLSERVMTPGLWP